MSRISITCIHHRLGGDHMLSLIGRDAWACYQLVKAGGNGCTPIDVPGPRWSHYIYKLRGAGLSVETINENHNGPYPGSHARYVLRSRVTLSGDAIRDWCGKDEISGGAPKEADHEAAA